MDDKQVSPIAQNVIILEAFFVINRLLKASGRAQRKGKYKNIKRAIPKTIVQTKMILNPSRNKRMIKGGQKREPIVQYFKVLATPTWMKRKIVLRESWVIEYEDNSKAACSFYCIYNITLKEGIQLLNERVKAAYIMKRRQKQLSSTGDISSFSFSSSWLSSYENEGNKKYTTVRTIQLIPIITILSVPNLLTRKEPAIFPRLRKVYDRVIYSFILSLPLCIRLTLMKISKMKRQIDMRKHIAASQIAFRLSVNRQHPIAVPKHPKPIPRCISKELKKMCLANPPSKQPNPLMVKMMVKWLSGSWVIEERKGTSGPKEENRVPQTKLVIKQIETQILSFMDIKIMFIFSKKNKI